ncbi:hypothetical protein C8R44DRAFT_729825 [Mycena epipterygia]|nr:hypothetical protein C8R44DRAFT_729825 [Mycena epipterygia]
MHDEEPTVRGKAGFEPTVRGRWGRFEIERKWAVEVGADVSSGSGRVGEDYIGWDAGNHCVRCGARGLRTFRNQIRGGGGGGLVQRGREGLGVGVGARKLNIGGRGLDIEIEGANLISNAWTWYRVDDDVKPRPQDEPASFQVRSVVPRGCESVLQRKVQESSSRIFRDGRDKKESEWICRYVAESPLQFQESGYGRQRGVQEAEELTYTGGGSVLDDGDTVTVWCTTHRMAL